MASTDALAARRQELERRLAELSPEKRAQLERATTASASGGDAMTGAAPAIARRSAGSIVPLSFTQEIVWLLEQVNPGHMYNVSRTARLTGPLNLRALQSALDALVARHEVLRTTFPEVDGEPQQLIHAPAPVLVTQLDMSGVPAAARDDTVVRRVQALVQRPFDLAADAQLRVTLIALATDDHVLVLESHHVASDEWSRNIVLRELAALYEGFCTGAPAKLPPLPIQYGDYAAWQRETLRGAHLERLLDYWRGKLAGAPTLLDLPTDRPRAAALSFQGANDELLLPLDLLKQLRKLSSERGVTLFMTLLAAFEVLLARYSGQDDIVVGSPVAGRLQPETQGLVGYFSNTLVLRTLLDGNPTFVELLARVRDTCLGAYEHQEVPFEKLMLDLQRERADRTPLGIQVLFTLQDPDRESLRFHGVTVGRVGVTSAATKSELLLVALEQADALRVLIEYSTDLFSAPTIARMLVHFRTLLESIVREPAATIGDLTMLPAEEFADLIVGRNQTDATYPDAMCIHRLVEAQAGRAADAVAVEQGERRLTFGELDRRANRIAHRLRELGIGPEVGVGVCIPRSPELIVALLGVLKSGGFYVPLDPDYPAERLAFMQQDAQLGVVLTAGAQVEGAQSLLVTEAMSEFETCPATAGDWDVTPEALAYVIYTSGSTGRPKGVQVRHRSVVNYVHWMCTAFPHDHTDAVLQKASASFDASVWELYLPLFAGARMVLADPGVQVDPAALVETLRDHTVTTAQFVPSQLQMMLEAGGLERCGALRQIICGGEALPADLLRRLVSALPGVAVANVYGPTETTVYSTVWKLDRDRFDGSAPIGRPIANTSVYVLDGRGHPAPTGVPGELFIAGAGVARGYLNRPELTAEKFIPDPFGQPGSVMYRTGDRVRWRPDGELEYLGRADFQVKLRGHRIELGEIEAVLAAQAGVGAAAVIVREDVAGDRRLVAYVVPVSGGAPLETDRLHNALREALPAYMVPGTMLLLEQLPLNANGKLDRKALPAPSAATQVGNRAGTPIEGAVESVIAGVWSEVLGMACTDAEQDFFDAGGHSLLAMRVVSRLSRLFGIQLLLRTFFQHASIREFARILVAAEAKPGRTEVVATAIIRLRDMTPEQREQLRLAGMAAARPRDAARDMMTEGG